MNSMSRRIFAAALLLMAVGLTSAAHPQGNPPENDAGATLFENVRIFDGKGASLSAPSNVLIKGNIIERISTEPIAAEPGVTVIAGNGRTLMPGLIDAHWHAMLIRPILLRQSSEMPDTTILRPALRRRRPGLTLNYLRSPASVVRMQGSSASWNRARLPICCWSRATRWRISN